MRATLRLSLPIRVLAAGMLGIAGLAFANRLESFPREAAPASEPAFLSPAAARAIGARWRQTRRPEAGRDYAQALLAAGMPGDLLDAVATEGLFADDSAARALFRGEALLRLYRYDDAIEAVSAPALADNPYAAFILVRARAGAGGGLDREALAIATRGPSDLAREAWLQRARVALETGDFPAMDASLKRAAEAGASEARLEPFRIERAIRSGATVAASEALAKRAKEQAAATAARGEIIPDIEGMRLAAMLALRAGDGREGARLVDRAGLGVPGARDASLAALAKWMAGDRAQAEAILSAHLRTAPGDWVARDLAAALAFDAGDNTKGAGHLEQLAATNPRLAAFRRMNRALAEANADLAYSSIASLFGAEPLYGAAAALLGEGVAVARLPEPVAADHALAAVASATDARSARAASAKLLGLRRSPLDYAAAGAALARAGLDMDAAALAFDASRSAEHFYAPVALRADILAKAGRVGEALASLEAFVAKNAGHLEASLARARLLLRLEDMKAAASAFAAIDPMAVFADDLSALDYARAAAALGDPWRSSMLAAASASLPPGERLGRVLEAAGETAGAAEAYREALINDPDAADLARAYREAMAHLGRSADADALIAAIARRREIMPEPAPAPDQGGA